MLKRISSFYIVLMMILTLLPLQLTTVSAAAAVTELVPYSTFDTVYGDDAGLDQSGAQVFGAPVADFWKPEAVGGSLNRISTWADEGNGSGSRVLTQTSNNSTGDLHKYMRLYATPVTGLTPPYQIMGKARMNLTVSNGTNASIEFGLSAGGTSKLRLVRVNTSGTSNNVSVNNNDGSSTSNSRVLGTVARGTWVDSVFVINVLNDTSAVATYYIDGVKYTTKSDGTTPFNITKANVDATTSARFALIAGGSAKVDNVGVYAVSGGSLPFTANSLTNQAGGAAVDIEPNENIILNFSNEIYKDALLAGGNNSRISIDGIPVTMDRISVRPDQKSIEILPPAEGYAAGASCVVTIDQAGLTDVFGTELAPVGALSFTVAGTVVIQPFTVNSFNGGVETGVSIYASPTIVFSTNVSKQNLSGKLFLQKGTDAGNIIPDANIEQVNAKTVKLVGYTFDASAAYTVTIASDAADDLGTVISGATSFSFVTAAAPMECYEDYEAMADNYKPVNDTAKGFYYSDKPSMGIISADGKKYLSTKADSTDQNVGVRAASAFSGYSNKVLFNSRIKLASGTSDSYTRVRMNTSDTNHVHLVLFQNNKIGILDYPGSAKDILAGENWTYSDNVWYDLSIILNLNAGPVPLISVYITGADGTSYKKENIQMLAENLVGSPNTTVVQDWVTSANSIYFYSNNKANGMDMLIDNMGLSEIGPSAFKDVLPADNAAEVDTNSAITVSFTNPVRSGGAAAALMSSDGGAVLLYPLSFANNDKTVIIKPQQELLMGTEYTLTLTGITDYTGAGVTVGESKFSTKSWSLFAKHLSFSPNSLTEGTITANLTAQNKSDTPKEITLIMVQCAGTADNYMVKKVSSKKVTLAAGAVDQPVSISIDVTDVSGTFVQVFVWDLHTYEPVMFMPGLLQ